MRLANALCRFVEVAAGQAAGRLAEGSLPEVFAPGEVDALRDEWR